MCSLYRITSSTRLGSNAVLVGDRGIELFEKKGRKLLRRDAFASIRPRIYDETLSTLISPSDNSAVLNAFPDAGAPGATSQSATPTQTTTGMARAAAPLPALATLHLRAGVTLRSAFTKLPRAVS